MNKTIFILSLLTAILASCTNDTDFQLTNENSSENEIFALNADEEAANKAFSDFIIHHGQCLQTARQDMNSIAFAR